MLLPSRAVMELGSLNDDDVVVLRAGRILRQGAAQ